MLNSYSTNFIKNNNKPYSQINIDKITRPAMNNRKRACSINIDKIKSKGKIMPSVNSLNKKNVILKTISVNKQIQYKKKAIGQFKIDNNCISSFNCISNIKDTSYNNNINKPNKNQNYNLVNNNNKNFNATQCKKQNLNNYSNNKLRRKMILSVDINNININNNNDISQTNEHNNITSISEMQIDQNNNINNNEYSVTYGNNNPSNPMSNGAKANSVSKSKPKTLSVNYQNHSRSNVNIKSPQKNTVYSNNLFNTCVGNNNKKGRNPSNNIVLANTNIKNSNNNNNINKNTIQIKQPFKLYNDNSSSVNLTTSCNSYQIQLNKMNNNNNCENNNNNFTKCTNIKNSNNNFYKSQNNNSNNNNNHDARINTSINNNYKFLKEVIDIQTEMDKSLKENPTNSKSKKYNTLKHAFENLLKLLGNTIFKYNNNIINVFLEKILIGYHEVVSAFSIENRKLKQLNLKINEQYEKGNKELIFLSKSIKEKQKQIELLKKKISDDDKKNNNNHNNLYILKNNNINNGNINNGESKEFLEKDALKLKQEQNKKIFKMNEQNLDDLDALYFFDKIEMDSPKCPSSKGIPKIPIPCLGEEEEEDDDSERNYKMHHAKTKSDLTLGKETKFKSLAFIKVKQAFS